MTTAKQKSNEDVIVSFHKATLRIRHKLILPDTNWVVRRHQHWAILGPNGAGKSTLARALAGQVPVVRGKLRSPAGGFLRRRVAYVSFDQHKDLMALESRRDEARWYSGNFADQTTVEQYLADRMPPGCDASALVEAMARLQSEDLLDRGVRRLSNGEMRLVLIAGALLQNPEILILDEPHNGLDRETSNHLAALIDELTVGPRPVILVTHRAEEIPSRASHVMGIKNGRIAFQGPIDVVLKDNKRLQALYGPCVKPEAPPRRPTAPESGFDQKAPVVEISDAVVRYRAKTVLQNLSWTVLAGENWALLGPNGAGKTTLLSLIYADNPQAYANDVKVFGRRRGSGETIWEVKQRIGLVSAELQVGYRKGGTVLETVLSGFYDTIGLYRRPGEDQTAAARRWMQVIGIESLARRNFERLSNGEQRLVLIARALVKSPRILLLDEPAQGLDPVNRRRILAAVDAVCARSPVSLIFVTHHPDALPGCITHVMELVPTENGSIGQASQPDDAR